VGDIEKTTVSGLDGCLYDSRVVGAEENGLRQQGDVCFGMEVDRVYFNDGTVVIDDAAQNRRIRVEKSGSRITVVWNPWIAKSRKMADFGDEEYHSMLCIEAANLLSDTITVPPYSEHSLSQTIGVE
jgi:glucose-6-phosphate 1-epimerase